MSAPRKQTVDELKQQGNDAVRAQNYSAAVIHYTHALRMDPQNHFLYSNRSLAFLKLEQFYFAIEDAKDVIKMQPKWPKGYYRKGEVELQAGIYTSAIVSFGQALLLDPTCTETREAVQKTNREIARIKKERSQQPWIFCGGGVLVGILLILADQFLTKQPSIQYTIVQVLLVTVFASIGYGCLAAYRYLKESQKFSLLEPPVDLLSEMSGEKSEEKTEEESDHQPEVKRHKKGGTGAARQRYKKGKS